MERTTDRIVALVAQQPVRNVAERPRDVPSPSSQAGPVGRAELSGGPEPPPDPRHQPAGLNHPGIVKGFHRSVPLRHEGVETRRYQVRGR